MAITLEIPLSLCRTFATVHVPTIEADRHVAILYFHGGGLLYGSRDDLPSPYVRAFLDAGFTLYCCDYPLAPEATLEQIRTSVLEIWRWFVDKQMSSHGFDRYFLFGRSAGAYLALLLARDVRRLADASQPAGILSFYGFYNLRQPFFSKPNSSFAQLPEISKETVKAITKDTVVTNGPKALRFSLYVHARQAGTWTQLLGISHINIGCFSLSPEDVAELPPLFITASSADEDVPFGESMRLHRCANQATFKPVYHLPHDFDRDTTETVGMDMYRKAIAWMGRRAT